MFKEEPHHIIAIGASAGGMEEINTFFDHTPMDGVSYVIVQHLSADFKSRMVELLSKHSKLTVQQAEEGMVVESNQVYLIPNDKFMTISGSALHLTDKEKVRGPHMTVNMFFSSLAADCGLKAIGVILSGLGSDGSEGAKAIKKAGGMLIAREPETTEFASMPSSAIATGMVDYVLEPKMMPGVIEDYVKREIELMASQLSDDQNMDKITALIHHHLPLDFSDYKQSTILRRIKRRAVYHNIEKLEDYLEFLKGNSQELQALAKDFLISVTAFFRDPEAFALLEHQVLPAIIDSLPAGQELRMWVPGCATGEEAYSLAMLVSEYLAEKSREVVVKIFATDLDSAALAYSGKGVYTPAVTKNVPAGRLEKFFSKEGENYKVIPEIRRMVIFAQHDLVKNPPYCNMDLVSCRNLLIYMNPALQKKIYQMLLFGLKQDGTLFLGSSENPVPILDSLEITHKKFRIYKKRSANSVVNLDAFSLPQVKHKPVQAGISGQDNFKNTDNTLAAAVNETILKDLDWLVVCIDDKNKIVKTYGDTTRFLLQKILTSDLTELLPVPLAVAFKTLTGRVNSENEKAAVNEVTIRQGQQAIQVNLAVSPMVYQGRSNGLRLVRIYQHQRVQPEDTGLKFDESVYFSAYTTSLEQEVKDLKEELDTSRQKLYSLDENMQSYNEELLSANEEMQSTNEEMQSVNEELHTINTDYQLKNKELIGLNDDLNNYFRSNINGQLFIDKELRLMKFSPGAARLINLVETDIGRPLGHISTNLKFETILADTRQVLSEGVTIRKETETHEGKWFQVVTMPYIEQASQKTNGAIITFNDITELKLAQQQLDKRNRSLLRINSDLDNFVHTASHDLLAPLGSIEGSIAVMNGIEAGNAEMNEFLSVINVSIKKFRTLITDIAAVAKIENNTIAIELVDVQEIISNIEWSLKDKILAAGAVIYKDLEVTHILFSKKNLRSIVYNLVSNAVKFRNGQAPLIHIRTAKEADQILLSVRDNGIGMDKGSTDKIFSKYGRLQTDVEGQGIGLYLARKIVDSNGGHIDVESQPGKGSLFTIYFSENPELY